MVSLMVGRELANFYLIRESNDQPILFEVRNLRTSTRPNAQVSLEIRRGEIMGLSGLIGAGRSEFAQAVFGIDKAISGEILLDGKTIKIDSPRDAINQGIYLVPEDRRNTGLITGMSVRENITLPALERYSTAGIIKGKDERTVASRYAEELRIKTASVETKAANLSGGNQQKVVLAKWLSLDPKVIIFDEPTRGIDVGAKAEIYQLMRRLADRGVAILMISSDMEEILGNSDRVAVMHQGQITGVLDRPDCTEEAILHLAIGQSAHRRQISPS
jgi:ribose transport system ATP-binding protein